MMERKTLLLKRLDEIGQSLAATEGGLALIGLGSAGSETARMDDYSDLDFFAIVRSGTKQRYLDNLDWLTAVQPIAYVFQNTDDGFKLLYADGIFCEMAVFEPDELVHIPFASERLVWQHPDFDASLLRPHTAPKPRRDAEWLLGEALTNLHIGLGRFHRGEKLAAARFIQGFAVDRVLDLAGLIEAEQPAFRDLFGEERRFEQRFPDTAVYLPQFIQGYDRSPESALAILNFLDQKFELNPAMKAAVLELCQQ